MTGTNDSLIDTPSQGHSGQGPGRMVRQAREKASLSLEDLSAQIKLARHTLDAIERDDFAQLNEPVYVRGYYRKLSKVLPVNEAELLAAYERIAGHKAPPHPSKLILAGGAELGSGRRIGSKLAIGVIVIGVLIGALAFWGKNRVAEPKLTPDTVTPVQVTPTSTTPTPEASITPPPAEAMTAEAPVDAAASSAPAATSSAPKVANTGTTGPLQIQFDGTSWTEVKDAAGRVLLSGLVEAGSTQVLEGKPPFAVFFGNAPAVKVSFNGQSVDLTPFRRGDNTARFTLP